MAGSEAKRDHRHDLDCRPRDHRCADAVVCVCTSTLHPVAVQRARLRRLILSDFETLARAAGRASQTESDSELSAYGIKEFTNIQAVWIGPAST
jgi:hypothetical protein